MASQCAAFKPLAGTARVLKAAEQASQANLNAADQLQKSQDELGRRQAELVAVRSELQSVQRDLRMA